MIFFSRALMIAASEGLAIVKSTPSGLQGERCVGQIEAWFALQMCRQPASLFLEPGRGPV